MTDAYKVPEAEIAFARRLLGEVPDLQALYDEHVLDNEGECLPYLLLADVARYVTREVFSGATGPAQPAIRIIEFMEHGMACGDERIDNLICLSFVEGLADDHGVPKRFKALLGPRLSEHVVTWWDWGR